LKEVKTNQNYTLNEEITEITLEYDKTIDVTLTNELKKGKIEVIKIDKDNNEVKLKGVEFQILDEDNNIVDTIITGENRNGDNKGIKS